MSNANFEDAEKIMSSFVPGRTFTDDDEARALVKALTTQVSDTMLQAENLLRIARDATAKETVSSVIACLQGMQQALLLYDHLLQLPKDLEDEG